MSVPFNLLYAIKSSRILSPSSKWSVNPSLFSAVFSTIVGSPPRIDCGFISFSHVTLLKCLCTKSIRSLSVNALAGTATPVRSIPFAVRTFLKSGISFSILLSTTVPSFKKNVMESILNVIGPSEWFIIPTYLIGTKLVFFPLIWLVLYATANSSPLFSVYLSSFTSILTDIEPKLLSSPLILKPSTLFAISSGISNLASSHCAARLTFKESPSSSTVAPYIVAGLISLIAIVLSSAFATLSSHVILISSNK